MSDWDADSADEAQAAKPAAPVATKVSKSKWDDEDASDDGLKDDWDASDEEPAKTAPTGPPPPIRQKGITKLKIAEKEAQEQAKIEARAAALALENDPVARRKAARERELQADMENARGLFGDDAVDAVAPTQGDPFESNPITTEQLQQVSQQIADLIIDKFGSKALYASFVEHHVKAVCGPLRDLETRKASSALATLANEKQKAAKDAAGGKKKKGASKPALGLSGAKNVGRGADTRMYDEAMDDNDDFDDFM